MSYALFAQRKLTLTGLLNGLHLQQTQRSNEQLALATNTLSLQQQLTSLQTAQSSELAEKYEHLAEAGDKFVQVRNKNGECGGYAHVSEMNDDFKNQQNYKEKGYVLLDENNKLNGIEYK